MNNHLSRCFLALLQFLLLVQVQGAKGQELAWIRQFGSSENDAINSVSVDGQGNVFVAGDTFGNLAEGDSEDLLLRKYNSEGELTWARQLNFSMADRHWAGVSADGLGNVYIAGSMLGPADNRDAVLAKYDANGNQVWVRQLGTVDGPGHDTFRNVAADARGNIYVSGVTTGNLDGGGPIVGGSSPIVGKYDADGNLNWIHQFRSVPSGEAWGVAVDSTGDAVFSGGIFGAFEGEGHSGGDAFVGKFAATGDLQWLRQFGTSADDTSFGVATDMVGNIYVSGHTFGSLNGINQGERDAFVRKYNSEGEAMWTSQLGTSSLEFGRGVVVDGQGSIFLAGCTDGDMAGSSGFSDAFLARLDTSGHVADVQQLGSDQNDCGTYTGVAADGQGGVYLAGGTFGVLTEPNGNGGRDGFLAKYQYSNEVAPGDTNGDGQVTIIDLNNVRNNFGGAGLGDTNGDGQITIVDLNNVRNNFGAGTPGGSPVPEPSSVVLALGFGLGLAGWLRRSSRT
jgi:hypothetical protein